MITDDIFHWAERLPHKTAVVYNGQRVSYRAFAQLIAIARGFFMRRGCVGPGVAAVDATNLLDGWIWILALRSLGLTTMAVNSASGLAERAPKGLRFVMVDGSDARADLRAFCEARGVWLAPVSLKGETPLDLDDKAGRGGHILQTSGTTGVYKSVLFDPAFEDAFMRVRCAANGTDLDSVNLVFNFGAWTGVGYKQPVCSWSVGATVVFYEAAEPHKALRYPGITHAAVVPVVLDAILSAPAGAFPRSEAMRLYVTGGTITQWQIDQAKARIGPVVCNALGATEVNAFGMTDIETPDDHRWHRRVPGVEVQVVDEFDQPVGVGQLGRVRVSASDGPTSYLDDEAATRVFFRDGWFYPGDFGVERTDGRFALQGRITDVINWNGDKLSPAPIEDRLRQDLAVTGVLLFSMQDDTGEEEIHVVVESAVALSEDRVAATLRGALPGHQMRARVHHVTSLPRNEMGKVLRQAARERVFPTTAAGPA